MRTPSGMTRRSFTAGIGSIAAGIGVGAMSHQASADDGLLVMDWTGYDVNDLFLPYVEKYGGPPEFSLFGDLESAFQKIRAGFHPDIMHADHWYVPIQRDLFEPWDTSRLTNYPDLLRSLVDMPTLSHDGQLYGLPADWGINSICYRSDLVTPKEESWSLLWDPDLSDRIAMTDITYDVVSVAGLLLGVEDPFVDDESVQQAIAQKMREQRSLVRFYWSDPTELSQAMASGEVVAAFAWPAVYTQLKSEGYDVRYMRPKEGLLGWAEALMLMKDRSGDTQKAYDFVDAWLSAGTAKWIIENYGYGHANMVGIEMASDIVKADLFMEDPERTLAEAFFIRNMSPKVLSRYVEIFENVKAGG